MTTRVFPIFRSLQRAILGGTSISKHEPALTLAHQNIAGDEIEEKTDEGIEKEEENQENVHLHDGHCSTRFEENNSATENRYSWPINSEEARKMRKEFVLEGFRRLYSSTPGRGRNETTMSGLRPDNNINHGDGYEAAFEGGRLDWQQTSCLRGSINSESSSDQPNRLPDLSVPTENGDWVYLAQ
mmetsp:Transcript_20858/g.42385  ORF Transcript_20858/g.42385 Transcript_20858/m.42385 type:complete len:185 (-) Transcript_20858:3324-3878(-)